MVANLHIHSMAVPMRPSSFLQGHSLRAAPAGFSCHRCIFCPLCEQQHTQAAAGLLSRTVSPISSGATPSPRAHDTGQGIPPSFCRTVQPRGARAGLGDVGNYLADAARQIFTPAKGNQVPWSGTGIGFSGSITHHDQARLREYYSKLRQARMSITGADHPLPGILSGVAHFSPLHLYLPQILSHVKTCCGQAALTPTPATTTLRPGKRMAPVYTLVPLGSNTARGQT